MSEGTWVGVSGHLRVVSIQGWFLAGPIPFQGAWSLHICLHLLRERKKHININKFAGLSRDWVGAKKLFMCFFRVIPYGGEKTHKQNSPKIPGQSRENFVYVFCSLCVFFSFPIYARLFAFVNTKTVPGQASAWNRFWGDFLEVWGVQRQTS